MKHGQKNSRQNAKHTHSASRPKSALQERKDTQGTLVILFLLFGGSALFRYLLSFLTLNMPTVYIDEGLYINIARSLFHDGQVMYRDQPISYVYLLYPIFLLPLFLLPSSVSLYRAVQFYNALLISSSVFPAYLLGRKIQLPRDRSIILAALTLLIPEFSLSSYLTAESLYYPLMMWVFVLAAEICNTAASRKTVKAYLAFGFLSGILYFAKPICVVFPCCFLLVDFVIDLREKDKRKACCSLCTLAGIGLVVAIGYIAYDLLFGKTTVLNLYEKQISETSLSSIPIMIQAFVYHIIALVFSCGSVFILLPFAFRNSYPKSVQKLMSAGIVGILASILGVAIMVVPYKYTGDGWTCPVHLRYLAYFFPFLMAFFLSPRLPDQKIGKGAAALFVLLTVCTVFPSAFRFFNYRAGAFDSPALNAFYRTRIDPAVGILLASLSVLSAAYLIYVSVRRGWQKKLNTIFWTMLILFFLVNGFCAYYARRTEDRSFEQDAARVSEMLADESDALIVTTNHYDDFRTFQIDCHLRKPVQMVIMNDMLLNCTYTGGVYKSWVPYVQAPNTSNNATVDTDTIVFDITTSDYVEFADSVATTKVGDYLIAKITPDKPFLKSAIASMDGFTLHHEDLGSLLIYDTEVLERGYVDLELVMWSSDGAPCTVTFACCGESSQVTLTDTAQSYHVTLPIQECNYFHFTISCSSDIIIGAYHTS